MGSPERIKSFFHRIQQLFNLFFFYNCSSINCIKIILASNERDIVSSFSYCRQNFGLNEGRLVSPRDVTYFL